LEDALHASLQSQQLPMRQPRQPDAALRERAVAAIVNLIVFMTRHCAGLTVNLRQPDFVLGLLYLLRCGVRVFDAVALQQLAHLVHMLPSEQHLQPAIGVRAKVVSEAENCVKHQVLDSEPPTTFNLSRCLLHLIRPCVGGCSERPRTWPDRRGPRALKVQDSQESPSSGAIRQAAS